MIKKELNKILKQSKSAPVLFLGSGFSRRYLGLEDWKGLLERFSSDLPQSFHYYIGKGKTEDSNVRLDSVASIMSTDFYEIWWNKSKYQESRRINEKIIINKEMPLKIEISSYLSNLTSLEYHSEELELLKRVASNQVVDTIITTNWDQFLEKNIFTSFQSYVGQEELLTSNHIGIEEIYKIHGCSSNPETLILTEENYFDFNRKNAYLSAKLLTTFIEHPVIFIGYSLSDKNIQDILKNISYSLSKSHIEKLGNNLIFIQPIFDKRDDYCERDNVTIDGVSIPRVVFYLKDYTAVYSSLLNYERKFPVKLVKLMKNSLYEIVKSNNSENKKIVVSDIESEEDLSRSDFIVGIGVEKKLEEAGLIYKKGVVGVTYHELLRDIVNNTIIKDANTSKDYSIEIIEKVFKTNIHIPVYKYLYFGGYFLENTKQVIPESIKKNLLKKYRDLFITNALKNIESHIKETYTNINEFLGDTTINLKYKATNLPLFLNGKNTDKLEEFINENFQEFETLSTPFFKLIKILDWFKYNKLMNK